MKARLLSVLIVLAAAGCAPGPVTRSDANPPPNPASPNGDVISRTRANAAPDTPAGVAPRPGYRDNRVDTDPASPRTRGRGQQVEVPVLTQ